MTQGTSAAQSVEHEHTVRGEEELFADAITYWRKYWGVSRAQLARSSGMHSSSICRAETKPAGTLLRIAVLIADALGAPVALLLQGPPQSPGHDMARRPVFGSSSPSQQRAVDERFGDALCYWRKARGLYQKDVAARVGTDERTIRRLERGATGATLRIAVRIADALEVPLPLLLQGAPRVVLPAPSAEPTCPVEHLASPTESTTTSAPGRGNTMARTVLVFVEDDLDGTPAASTITFGLEGRSYEIDLSERNAQRLRQALAPYLAVARPRGRGSSSQRAKREPAVPTPGTADDSDHVAVRAWAHENGIAVNDRGPVSKRVRQKFVQAQGIDSTTAQER
jgi:transcriptional regulator with XRE-family HTH domain